MISKIPKFIFSRLLTENINNVFSYFKGSKFFRSHLKYLK